MDLSLYDWFARMNFRLQLSAARFADLIISNSEAGRAHHLAIGFPANKFIVIQNGTDTERFRPDRHSGRQIRASWKIADDTVLIGLVGRLDPMKGHPTFLRAAAILVREESNVHFVCIGNGSEEYANSLRHLASEYEMGDRITWADARDDMPEVYNALDIACSSSFSEGLSNVICEAMACDVPCVVSDVGDSQLLAGDTEIVVPPDDPQALAAGLAKCIKRLAAGRRTNRRDRIQKLFAVGQFVRKTTEALLAVKGSA